MTGTNAICKKINAGSRGNNQRLLRVCCSLTETWSANAEKCSVAVLWSSCLHITVEPSRLSAVYLSQSFQTYQSCTHFYCLCWCLHYEDGSDYSVLGPEVSILSTFSWIIKMKVKNPGRIQTNYFKLVLGFIYEFILPYKGAGSTYTTALVQEASLPICKSELLSRHHVCVWVLELLSILTVDATLVWFCVCVCFCF